MEQQISSSIKEPVSNLLPFVQDALRQYSKGGPNEKQGITFATVVLISMQAVEKYSETISKLAGPDKLAAAKILVPQIIDLAVENGAIELNKAEELKSQFSTGASIVEQLVEAYVILSKHPQVIQAVEAVTNAAKSCWAKCKEKKEHKEKSKKIR
jgi:hypothetical protein